MEVYMKEPLLLNTFVAAAADKAVKTVDPDLWRLKGCYYREKTRVNKKQKWIFASHTCLFSMVCTYK